MCAGPAAGTGGARAARGPALRGRTWWRRRRGHGWAGEEEGTEPFPTPPFLRGDAPGACAAAQCLPVPFLPPFLLLRALRCRSVAAPPASVPVTPLRPCRVPAALPGSGARPLHRCPIPLLPPALALPGALFQPPVPLFPFLLPLHSRESRWPWGGCGGPSAPLSFPQRRRLSPVRARSRHQLHHPEPGAEETAAEPARLQVRPDPLRPPTP